MFIGFGFVLNTAGPAGIWTWVIALVGQTLVALICAALAAKFPLSGYHYQWGTLLLYVGFSHRVRPEPGYFHLGRWEKPVLTGAFLWVAYELIILFGPA